MQNSAESLAGGVGLEAEVIAAILSLSGPAPPQCESWAKRDSHTHVREGNKKGEFF